MEVAALGLRVDGVTDIDSASSSLDKFQKSAARAENSADSFGQGTGKAFAAASKSLTGFEALAARAAKESQYLAQQVQKLSDVDIRNNDIQAYGAELDRLRAKYNPLFAASKAYETELDELNRAHRVGAINAQEHANALNTLNARFAQSGAAANTAKVNYQALGGGMGGLAAQFQDIGVTAAMGMNPLIIGLQQGTQIAGQMEAAMSRGASAVGVFSTAFKSLLGPVTAASIGLTVLASALIQAVDWAKLGKTALNALADAIEVIAPYAAVAAAGLAVLYAPTILGGIISLTTALLNVGKAALTAAAAFALANPATVLVVGFAAAVTAAYVFRDAIKKEVGVDVIGVIKDAANYVINSFVAAYEDIKFVWNNFGNVMGAAVIGGVNIAITAINKLIQAAVDGVNGLIGLLNNIPGVDIGNIGESLGISEIANPYAKMLEGSAAERNKKLAEIMGRDSVGAFIKGASEAGDKAADWLRKLTFGDDKKGKTRNSELQNLIKNLEIQYATLGMTAEQAGRYEIQAAKGTETDRKRALALYDQIQAWKETEKAMQQAMESGRLYLAFQREMEVFQQKVDLEAKSVGLSDRQREIAEQQLAVQQEYAEKRIALEQAQQVTTTALEASQYQERLRLLSESENQKLALITEGAAKRAEAERDWTNGLQRGLQTYLDELNKVSKSMENIVSGTFKGMEDALVDFVKTGKVDFRSLADSIITDLIRIAIQQAVLAPFTGWFSGLFGFSKGAAFAGGAVQKFASGGAFTNTIASSPTLAPMALFGEAGPEAIMPLSRGSDGSLGVRASLPDQSSMNSVLERIDARQRMARENAAQSNNSPAPIVNVIEDSSRAGRTEVVRNEDGGYSTNVFVSQILGDGDEARVLESTYGLRRIGR